MLFNNGVDNTRQSMNLILIKQFYYHNHGIWLANVEFGQRLEAGATCDILAIMLREQEMGPLEAASRQSPPTLVTPCPGLFSNGWQINHFLY